MVLRLQAIAPVVGILLVLAAVLAFDNRITQVWVAAAGLLVMEVGVWKLGSRMIHERRFIPLRAEVEAFVPMVRRLNWTAVAVREGTSPDAGSEFESAAEAVRASVERMILAAGKTRLDVEQAPPAAEGD